MRPLDLVHMVHRFEHAVVSTAGDRYDALVYASERSDHTFDGWLVFLPQGGGRALPTDRETTQPSLETIAYWAGGLTPVYLEGALARAIALTPEAVLERRAIALAREEAIARAEATAYEHAAKHARGLADEAARKRAAAHRHAREL